MHNNYLYSPIQRLSLLSFVSFSFFIWYCFGYQIYVFEQCWERKKTFSPFFVQLWKWCREKLSWFGASCFRYRLLWRKSYWAEFCKLLGEKVRGEIRFMVKNQFRCQNNYSGRRFVEVWINILLRLIRVKVLMIVEGQLDCGSDSRVICLFNWSIFFLHVILLFSHEIIKVSAFPSFIDFFRP